MSPTPLVDVRGLTVVAARTGRPVLDETTVRVGAGSTHALIGESGSGKTTLALAVLGRVRAGLVRTAGTVTVAGHDVLSLDRPALRAYRRRTVSWLGQDPLLALTPHLDVRETLTEIARRSDDELLALLRDVGLDGGPGILDRTPRQLSGGQRRRLAVARALVARPRLVVLDEPTSGLDAAAIDDVLDTLTALREQTEVTVLLITHDLDVAARFADQVSVMETGKVVETTSSSGLLGSPATGTTDRLVEAYRLSAPPGEPDPGPALPVLEVEGLSVAAPDGRLLVEDLSFELVPGEGTAVVGPSGVGKSLLVRCLVGLGPPAAGTVWLTSGDLHRSRLAPSMLDRTPGQRRAVQMIAQDPAAALNPALTVRTQLSRAVRRAEERLDRDQVTARVEELLASVCLHEDVLESRPLALSGGQAQRVAIARALAHRPRVLVCDESTSALDPSVQHEVLDTLNTLRRTHHLALVVVTHSPAVARYTCQQQITLHSTGTLAERTTYEYV